MASSRAGSVISLRLRGEPTICNGPLATISRRNFRQPGQPANALRAGGPDLLGALPTLLLGGPELLARLRLLDRDRLGVLHEEIHRAPHRDVLAQRLVAP